MGVMLFLQTVVVCTVLCLCLSTTPEPGWWARQMGRLFKEKYRGPVALDHEQTIAVVTHNGPDDTIDRLDNNKENINIRTAQVPPYPG